MVRHLRITPENHADKCLKNASRILRRWVRRGSRKRRVTTSSWRKHLYEAVYFPHQDVTKVRDVLARYYDRVSADLSPICA